MKSENAKIKNLFLDGLKRYKELSFWGKRIIASYSYSVVLDHGCGTGAEIAQITRDHRGYLVGTDIDLSRLIVAKMLTRKCCKTCQNVDLVLADSTRLPFAGERFDFVLSSFVLEHIRRREAAVEEMRRVLKDGGCAIISLDTYLRCIRRCTIGYRTYLTGFLMFIVSREKRKRFVKRFRSRAGKEKMIRQRDFNRLELLFKRLRRGMCILSYLVFPIRHGDYEHSAQEFVSNLPSSWINLIKRSNFKKIEVIFPSTKQRVRRYPGEMMIKAYN